MTIVEDGPFNPLRVRRWPCSTLERVAPQLSLEELAAYAGYTDDDARCWRSARYLDDLEADRLAIAGRVHPVEVWPDWFDVYVGDDEP